MQIMFLRSYDLEQKIVGMNFLFCYNIKDYFYYAVEQLHCSYWSPQWKQNSVNKLKNIVSSAKAYESGGWPYSAEAEIKKILPEI